MSVRDFLSEAVVVVHHGRRFIVHKPTCETVGFATLLFGVEIGAAYATFKQAGGLGADPAAALIPMFMQDRTRLAVVLGTIVDLPGAVPDEVRNGIESDPDLALLLVRGILTVCDITRIVASFDMVKIQNFLEGLAEKREPAVTDDDDEEQPISALESMVDRAARRYGVTPGQAMKWPYEMVLAITDLCLKSEQKPTMPAAAPGVLAALARNPDLGIGYDGGPNGG